MTIPSELGPSDILPDCRELIVNNSDSLESLYLMSNDENDTRISHDYSSLLRGSSLKSLHLQFQNSRPEFGWSIGKLDLHVLHIWSSYNSFITSSEVNYISEALPKLKNCKELYFMIEYGHLEGGSTASLGTSINKLSTLERLRLQFHASVNSRFIFDKLKGFPKLKYLNVKLAPPLVEDMSALAQYFSRQTNISELSLSLGNGKIPEKPSQVLLEEIKKMKALRVLDLELGIIHTSNFLILINILKNLSGLEKLNLAEKSGLITTTKMNVLLGLPNLRDIWLNLKFPDPYECYIPLLDDPSLLKRFDSFVIEPVSLPKNQKGIKEVMEDIEELRKYKDLIV